MKLESIPFEFLQQGDRVQFIEPVDKASRTKTYTVKDVTNYTYIDDRGMIWLKERPGGWCILHFRKVGSVPVGTPFEIYLQTAL